METFNYNRFKIIESNRNITKGLVKKLEQSIKELGFVKSRPILVNKNFEIIDGQHRFTACKNLGLPIHYEVSELDISSDELMIKLNSVQQVWQLKDYCIHFAKKEVPFYVEVLRLHNEYQVGFSNILSICMKNKSGQAANTYIKKGIDFELDKNRLDIIKFIKRNSILNFNQSNHFVKAIKICFEKLNQKQIEKIESKILGVSQQANTSIYLNIFEQILNKGKHREFTFLNK
jgi:hypothetical protein